MVKRKQFLLLIFGITGSLLMMWVLQKSVQNTLARQTIAPEYIPQTPNGFTLPITIPGTTLQAKEISAYEGPFLEDGYGQEVVDIAALHIYNTGDLEVRNACITLQTEDSSYVFYGTHIPPGATVVLLEINACTYRLSKIQDCFGWQEISNQIQQDGVLVTDKDNGTLIVKNTTEQTLKNVCLYYKSWLSPPDVYMGGITYSVTIPLLTPGQEEMLCPDRYATGYSKVVSIVADP